MTNLINQSLGRYHILEQLGEGGMAKSDQRMVKRISGWMSAYPFTPHLRWVQVSAWYSLVSE